MGCVYCHGRQSVAQGQRVPPAQSGNIPSAHANAKLAKESREAAGEDEQAQFKHSASVQLVAKLTGLSLDARLLALRVAEFCSDRWHAGLFVEEEHCRTLFRGPNRFHSAGNAGSPKGQR